MQSETKSGFNLGSLLNQSSLEAVNNYLKNSGYKVHYSKSKINNNIRVIRAIKNFKFWDRLMREKPGDNKGKEG